MFDGDKNEMQAFATNLRIVDNAPVNHRALADSLLRQAELMAEAVTRADDDDRGPWHKQTRMLAELAAVHAMLVDVGAPRDELDRLRELNSDQVAEVVELRREVDKLDTENAELRSRLGTDADTVLRGEQNAAQAAGVQQLETNYSRVWTDLIKARERNKSLVAHITELRRKDRSTDTYTRKLEAENSELRGQVAELEQESVRLRGERDHQEQRNRTYLTAANKRIDAQSARISELEAQLREVSRPNVSPVPPKAWTCASSTLPPQSINALRSVDEDGPYLLRCQNNPTRWYWSTSGPEPRKDHRCGSWPNIVGQRPGLILVAYEPNKEDDDD
jgi:myosin heavy subunit